MQNIGRIALVGALLLTTATAFGVQDKVPVKLPVTPDQQQWQGILARCDYQGIAKAYADFMITHGRDVYGPKHTPLFVTAMDRKTGQVFKHGHVPYPHVIAKPYAPGLRRDHKMRPQDRTYSGGNPLEDLPLYGLLYRLGELTGEKRYAEEADKSIAWFLANAQSPATGLYAWGSHMYWDVHRDQPIYANTGRPNGGYGGHEYNYVWPYWDQNPDALKRFAHGLWDHQITDRKTGRFSRHAAYHKHGPGREWFEFPRMGSCMIDIWARQFGRGGDAEMKQAIRTLLKFYRALRDPKTGAMAWCSAKGADRREVANVSMNLAMATTLQDAAAFVQKRDPALAEEMRTFAHFIDDEYLSNDYDKTLDVAGKGILTWYTLADRTCMAKGFTPPPDGVDASVGFPLKTVEGKPAASLYYLTPWFPGRSYAEFSLLMRDRLQRCDAKHKPTYRRALIDVANMYMTIQPEVQFALYPDNIADVVELLRHVYKVTQDTAYLHRADQMMRLGVRLFFDDTSPLPKISNFDNWYESSLKNESSVAILRQMIELSIDLSAIAKEKRAAPEMPANGKWEAPNAPAAGNMTPEDFAASFETAASAGRAGCWSRKGLTQAEPDAVLKYGTKGDRALYLSKSTGTFTADGLHAKSWRINLSDTITRIPTSAEADKLNGRMKRFTGKGHTAGLIAYGGYKDVPRQVAIVIGNTGSKAARVRVEANFHDTYHDNGSQQCVQTLAPGKQGLFLLGAPALKWIRRLTITNETETGKLSLVRFAFVMAPRSDLMPGTKTNTKQNRTAQTSSAGYATYYIDVISGSDKHDGRSTRSAWKSLARLDGMEFKPGDRIHFKAGCRFVGSLHPKGSGTAGKPIVIDRYGEGANPILAGGGKVENTIRLHNQHHWEIRNLTVTNTDGGGWDDQGRSIRRAVYVTAEDAGDVEHIHLKNLEIRDVRGMYRFKGNETNGGIICRVTGKAKETRFVDLRIEGCTFRTKSIDRYPVVVTSSWRKAPACEVVWANNRLDHVGRAHIVIPTDQWPRKLVYYFDPEVRQVFPLSRTAPPVSPLTGRVGCEDIFSEMAARLKRSWSFFEATRAKEGEWLFKYSPGDKGYSLWATSSDCLAYYGEIRALGFEPPWIKNEKKVMHAWINGINRHLDPKSNLLKGPTRGAPRGDWAYISHSYDWISRNRVFSADRYSLPPGGLHGGDPLPTKEAAIQRFNSFNWKGNTYQVCNQLGKAMKSHAEIVRAKGKDPAKDPIIMMLHEMLDEKFVNGRWGKGGTADGNMKMAVTYCTYDWPIPDHKALIDFTLDGANGRFKGRGCSAFNQMWVLAEARRQFPDGYRGDEIDKSLAQSFLTFLKNWNEDLNFYSNNWRGKHNNGVVLFMSHLLLDIPLMRGSAVYNWRQNPIITRGKDGTITRNKVIYVTPGYPFYD